MAGGGGGGGDGDGRAAFAAARRSMRMHLLVVLTSLLALAGTASSANVAFSDVPSQSEKIDLSLRLTTIDSNNNPLGPTSAYNPTLYFDSSGPSFKIYFDNDQTTRAYVNNASDGTLDTAYAVYDYDPTESAAKQCMTSSAPSYVQLLCRNPVVAFVTYPIVVDGASLIQSITPGDACSAYSDADSVGAWNCSTGCVNKTIAFCLDSSQNAIAVISLTGYRNGSSSLRIFESTSVTDAEETVNVGSVFSCSSFNPGPVCTLQSFTAVNLATTPFPAVPSGSSSPPAAESSSSGGGGESHTGVVVGAIAGAMVLVAVVGVVILLCRKHSAKRKQLPDMAPVKAFVSASSTVPPPPPFEPDQRERGFTIERPYMREAIQMDMGFDDLVAATNNFDPYYKIGEGGYGHVYCARFSDGSKAAVKRIELNPSNRQLAEREVQTEVDTMSQLSHPNIVRFYTRVQRGSTVLLVLEYVEGGTLEDRLQDTSNPLTWVQRMRIAVGVARALAYLHGRCIVHRDVRPANVLLDRYAEPQLADFGLAKTANSHNLAALNKQTRVLGAAGYVAPEYASSGKSSFKSDCYSFGVVLMQLLTGRQVIDSARSPAEMLLARRMAQLIDRPEEVVKLMDPLLHNSVTPQEFIQVASLAVRCTQHTELMRPTAGQLLRELEAFLPLNRSSLKPSDYPPQVVVFSDGEP